jgi:hypothetical protein
MINATKTKRMTFEYGQSSDMKMDYYPSRGVE